MTPFGLGANVTPGLGANVTPALPQVRAAAVQLLFQMAAWLQLTVINETRFQWSKNHLNLEFTLVYLLKMLVGSFWQLVDGKSSGHLQTRSFYLCMSPHFF